MRVLFSLVFCLTTALSFSQQRDSLRVYIQGVLDGEKYRVYYNHQLIREYHCHCRNREYKKFGGEAHCSYYFSLPVDSLMAVDNFLKLDVYKKTGFKYRNTYFSTYYDPTKKYLIIYRNHRLKKRYAVDDMWEDEQLHYE